MTNDEDKNKKKIRTEKKKTGDRKRKKVKRRVLCSEK